MPTPLSPLAAVTAEGAAARIVTAAASIRYDASRPNAVAKVRESVEAIRAMLDLIVSTLPESAL